MVCNYIHTVTKEQHFDIPTICMLEVLIVKFIYYAFRH